MTTSTAELSCTVDEVEEADVCLEIQICDICGDVGYDDELAVCSQCNDSSQHIYCMATMNDRVPLRWICERCDLEEKKGSLKKRPAGNEPRSTQPYKKQNTNGLSTGSTFSTFNEAKNVFLERPFISRENGADVPSVLFSSVERHEGRAPAVETCLSTHRQGEAVAILHATIPVRGPSGFGNSLSSGVRGIKAASEIRTAQPSSIKENLESAPKDASKHPKLPSDGLFLGSKRVYSRSVSMKSDSDDPFFLLPSRPKHFVRSKSAVVRPSASWTSEKGLSHHATHKHVGQGSDSTKSIQAGPSPHPYRQAGEDTKQSNNVDVTKQSNNGSPRASDPFQHRGWNDKESRRCYRCQEMGHIAAMCNNTSQARECESSRGQGRTEKGRPSTQESFSGLRANKEGGAVKESSSWRSLGADSSGASPKLCLKTPTQVGTLKLGEIATVSLSKREGSLGERSLWKSHRANCSGGALSNRSQQRESPGKGRLGRRDTVNVAVENQAAGVQFLHDQDGNATTSATTRQTQDVDPITEEKKTQEAEGILCHKDSRCGSGTPMMPMADPDISSDSSTTIKADPCIEMLWSGCFNVTSKDGLTTYKGLQAHPSTKADPRVSEALKTLPFELYLEELKRGRETDTWPRSLQEQPATRNSIGIYFFPVDMECHDMWYKPLVDHLAANDLALKTDLESFQLLIFPSQLLPQADQCWEDRQYLWGILRKATSINAASNFVTLGVAL